MTWFQLGLRYPVPFNLIWILGIVIGILALSSTQRQMFPETEMNTINITVALEESQSPELVDSDINERIYAAIEDLEGVKQVSQVAFETFSSSTVSIREGFSPSDMRDEIARRVDSISNLPTYAKRPIFSIDEHPEYPIGIAVTSKDNNLSLLRQAVEWIEDDIRDKKVVRIITPTSLDALEIRIEVAQDILRAKNLTFENLARQLSQNDMEVSCGHLDSHFGRVMIKNSGRKKTIQSIGAMPIALDTGEALTLKELVGQENIIDGFADADAIRLYNGLPASFFRIKRAPGEDTLELCEKVRKYVKNTSLPFDGISMVASNDLSPYIQGRIDLIVSNAKTGLVLILITLALFLDFWTALWVSSGIFFAVLCTLPVMNFFGVSINMVSLFGFLVTLGIVVDDAIVVGESFYEKKQQGLSGIEAAQAALDEVSMPVIAMMTTTIAAFIPILFIEGSMGKIMKVIPVVVISALCLSLFEALFILPSHLAFHHNFPRFNRFLAPLELLRPKIADALDRFSFGPLKNAVSSCARHRYASFLFFFSMLVLFCGLITSGRIGLAFFPPIDSDVDIVTIKFRDGTDNVDMLQDLLALQEALNKADEGLSIVEESFCWNDVSTNPTQVTAIVSLVGSEQGRTISSAAFRERWRSFMPPFPAIESIEFQTAAGGPKAKGLEIEFYSSNIERLTQCAKKAQGLFEATPGLVDIASSYEDGPVSAFLEFDPTFAAAGLSEASLVNTVRSFYQGTPIDRFYRNGHEVRVKLMAPQSERASFSSLSFLRLPQDIPLEQIADIALAQRPSSVRRIDGRRAITVGANLNEAAEANENSLRQHMAAAIQKLCDTEFHEVSWGFSGKSKDGAETTQSMLKNFLPALLLIYWILATLFGSYIQPIIIMIAIPFSFVGAIFGHAVMGLPISLMSGFGMVALAGIAVNDSLVLIDAINVQRAAGEPMEKALVDASIKRFRPILLTSLTTIAGMLSVLFEKSLQAQFLIPMVTSLVFGIAFATVLILLLIPAGYAIVADIQGLFSHDTSDK